MSTEQIYTEEFDVHRYVWDVDTRPCEYTLALGDVAFADFDVDEVGRLVLVRISFDGYGCCTPDRHAVAAMDADDSRELIRTIESDEPIATDGVRSILRRYFEGHRDVVWEDALLEWGLVSQATRDAVHLGETFANAPAVDGVRLPNNLDAVADQDIV